MPYNENILGGVFAIFGRQQQEEMKSLIQNSLTLGERIKLQKQAKLYFAKTGKRFKKGVKT
ncbi:MAG: hypothetical protein PHG19_11060, partial [Anaerotignum sp.]|nr:hypothetical protein [Anaerotignum sp.]